MMDEVGSVGLDLSFAGWVFLMEPLEDGSLEAQVVARAHRMGAPRTRPVRVETLVMQVWHHDCLLPENPLNPAHPTPSSSDAALQQPVVFVCLTLLPASAHQHPPCCVVPQDTAEEVILGRTQGAHAAGASSGGGAGAADPAVTDRRVLRNALLVSLRRVAISGDQDGRTPAAD